MVAGDRRDRPGGGITGTNGSLCQSASVVADEQMIIGRPRFAVDTARALRGSVMTLFHLGRPVDQERSATVGERRFPRRWMVVGLAACGACPAAVAQQLGPMATAVAPVAGVWPARPPARVYVLPFGMEPGLQEELRQEAAGGLVPQGPVRQMIAGRPRVVDMVTGHDRSEPPGVSVARLTADELARSGWPVVFWAEQAPPPADGWRLSGQVVRLDEGSAVARNAIGFGVGNKQIGIDIALSDPATAGGAPFFILDSSDKGRRMPGTVAIGAAAGFNPAVVAGKFVASNSGVADIAQQQRLADEIARSVAEAINQRAAPRR
jgi:hypothetical protein